MPQLAPMPWVTLFLLVFFFKSLIFSTLWSHRAPSFSMATPISPSHANATLTWPWM